MTEAFPNSTGDQAPLPLTPEQMRINEAGKVVARYICIGLESRLEGPDYYRLASQGAKQAQAIGVGTGARTEGTGGGMTVLQAYNDIRELTIHVPPTENGYAREYTYRTRYTPGLGYSPTPEDDIYAMPGSLTTGTTGSARQPLRESDLFTLKVVLSAVAPYPEVQASVEMQVEQIMTRPLEANDEA